MYPGSSLLHWGLKSLRVPSAEVPWWKMNMIKVRRKNQWKLQNFNPCLFSSASLLFSSFSPFACSAQILSICYKNLSSHPLNDSNKQRNRKNLIAVNMRAMPPKQSPTSACSVWHRPVFTFTFKMTEVTWKYSSPHICLCQPDQSGNGCRSYGGGWSRGRPHWRPPWMRSNICFINLVGT